MWNSSPRVRKQTHSQYYYYTLNLKNTTHLITTTLLINLPCSLTLNSSYYLTIGGGGGYSALLMTTSYRNLCCYWYSYVCASDNLYSEYLPTHLSHPAYLSGSIWVYLDWSDRTSMNLTNLTHVINHPMTHFFLLPRLMFRSSFISFFSQWTCSTSREEHTSQGFGRSRTSPCPLCSRIPWRSTDGAHVTVVGTRSSWCVRFRSCYTGWG